MNIPEELLPVVEWWEKDGKKTLAVAAVAGVAVLGWISWKSHAESVRAEAAAALAQGGDVETLQDAVGRFGDSEVGPLLKLKLAAAYCVRAEDGDAQSALDLYEAVAASGAAPAGFEDVPKVGKAECLEALGQWAQAVAAYEAYLANAATNAPLALAAKLGLARSLAQSGERDRAVADLEALLKENDGADAAKSRIEATLDVVKRWTEREPVVEEVVVEQPAPVVGRVAPNAPSDDETAPVVGRVAPNAPETPAETTPAEAPAEERRVEGNAPYQPAPAPETPAPESPSPDSPESRPDLAAKAGEAVPAPAE